LPHIGVEFNDKECAMKAYAVGYLHEVSMGPDIVAYLQRFDETLAPYDGHFIIHGGAKSVMEGRWPGDLIVIEFPDRDAARSWYDSPAYQAIIGLRTANSRGDVIIIDGVDRTHCATDILAP
jgi:uncharacterized protein (DUF1330 family)